MDNSTNSGQERRKRKFPYRKVADIETEIALKEEELQSRESDLCNPEILRDGRKVKEAVTAAEQLKADLARLYEHWEESVELN